MNSRQKILENIKKLEKLKSDFVPVEPDWNEPDLVEPEMNLLKAFKSELEKVGAFCFLCSDNTDRETFLREFVEKNKLTRVCCAEKLLVNNSNITLQKLTLQNIQNCEALITSCKYLVAQTGSVVLCSDYNGGRKSFVYEPVHIIFADEKQVKSTIKEVLGALEEEYGTHFPSQISFVTGSSRTADIEKTLVKGAHGPVKLAVFI